MPHECDPRAQEPPPPPSAPRPSLLRARVWLGRHAIDQRLAKGENILTCPELARRAEQLASVRSRRSLAAGLRELIEDAERATRALTSAVPIQRTAIVRARVDLERLAGDLEADDPMGIDRIARVQLLITDVRSPLYSSLPGVSLREAVADARTASPPD